jgi:hypothetical protein
LTRVWRRLVAGVVIAGVALAGCGSSDPSSEATPPTTTKLPPAPTSPPAANAEPAGADPSEASVMICSAEAQEDIAKILDATPDRVSSPTWTDQKYSCDYVYRDAVIGLSVKELSSAAETLAFFDEMGKRFGRDPGNFPMGDAWFRTSNDSIVVRKDYKVLHVEVSEVPEEFGGYSLTPQLVAVNVGETIMGCWIDA